MRIVVGIAAAVLALGMAAGTSAQSWGYDQYRADQAYHAAGHQERQARRDDHRARIAASYGDYARADHYARNADRHRWQARRDSGYGHYEQRAAGWDGRAHGWGY